MTVNTTKITSGPYAGNDVADEFSYTFKVEIESQIAVYETDDSGVQTLLTLDTHYEVNDVGDDDGGTITRLSGPLPSGYEWFIRSDYKETQLTAFESQGAFFPELHENAMDKLTFLIQQVLDGQTRSPSVSDVYTGALPLTLADPAAGYALRWNGDGDGLENYDPFSGLTSDEIAADKVVISYKTLNEAVVDDDLVLNQECRVAERTIGNRGGGTWVVVLATSVTPDTFGVVQCTGVPEFALRLRTGTVIVIEQFGLSEGATATFNRGAVQAAFDYAVAAGERNSLIVGPGLFDINGFVALDNPGGNLQTDLIMIGRFNYVGGNVGECLIIGSQTCVVVRNKYDLRVWNNNQTPSPWTSPSHVGIRLVNFNTCDVTIRESIGFTRGVYCLAYDQIFGYNVFKLCLMQDNAEGLRLASRGTGSGAANENKFFGGKFSQSGANPTVDRIGVVITSEDGSYVDNNSNTFYGPSFELSFAGTNVGTAIDIVHGVENQFRDFRIESVDSPHVITRNASRDNVFTTSFGAITVDDQGSAPSSQGLHSQSLKKLGIRQSWTSPHLSKSGTNYDGAGGAVMFPGCDNWATSGAVAIAFTGWTLANYNYAETTSGRGVGKSFETLNCKRLVLTRDCEVGFGGRVVVKAYNAAGTLLTGSSPNYVTGDSGAGLSSSANYGGCYETGSDSTASVYLALREEVASVDVIVTSGNSQLKIKSFTVVAVTDPKNGVDCSLTPFNRSALPQSTVNRYGTAIPTTGTYVAGDVIYHAAPALATPQGWVCLTSGTPGVWTAMPNL